MENLYQVTDGGTHRWTEIEADDLHEAAERYVDKICSDEREIASDESVRVKVKRADGEVFEFVVYLEYEPYYSASMLHETP